MSTKAPFPFPVYQLAAGLDCWAYPHISATACYCPWSFFSKCFDVSTISLGLKDVGREKMACTRGQHPHFWASTQNWAVGWPLAVKAANMLVAQAGGHRVIVRPFPWVPSSSGIIHQEFTTHSLSAFLPVRERQGDRKAARLVFLLTASMVQWHPKQYQPSSTRFLEVLTTETSQHPRVVKKSILAYATHHWNRHPRAGMKQLYDTMQQHFTAF